MDSYSFGVFLSIVLIEIRLQKTPKLPVVTMNLDKRRYANVDEVVNQYYDYNNSHVPALLLVFVIIIYLLFSTLIFQATDPGWTYVMALYCW